MSRINAVASRGFFGGATEGAPIGPIAEIVSQPATVTETIETLAITDTVVAVSTSEQVETASADEIVEVPSVDEIQES